MTDIAGPGQVIEFRWGTGPEDSFFAKLTTNDQGRGEVIVIDSGTESNFTMLQQLLGRGQDFIFPDFLVSRGSEAMKAFLVRARVIAVSAETFFPQLDTIFGVNNWDLMLTGHSLGAAEMLVTAFLLTVPNGPNPAKIAKERIQLVSFGCPRAMNPVAVGRLEIVHYRIHNAGDIVTHVPPNVFIFGPGVLGPIPNAVLSYFLGIPGVILTIYSTIFFEHHGSPLLLLRDGEGFTDDSDPEFVNLALIDIALFENNVERMLGNHGIKEYIRRLLLGLPIIVPPVPGRLPPFFWPDEFTENFFYSIGGISVPQTYLSQMAITFSNGQGYTEGHYQSAEGHDSALANLLALAVKRAHCLSLGTKISTLRVSDVAIQGDSQLMAIGNQLQSNLWPGDPFYSNLYFRLTGAPGGILDPRYHRQYFLGAVPDSIFVNGAYVNTADSDWEKESLIYMNELTQKPPNTRVWLMRTLEKPNAPHARIASVVIDTVAPNVGKLIVTTDVAHALPTDRPSQIRLAKIKWSGVQKAPNGIFNVMALTGTTFRILSRVGSKEELIYLGGAFLGGMGEFYRRNYLYIPIKKATAIRAASHRRGRPFGLLRGRARARAQS
jgi:hypothetical protein